MLLELRFSNFIYFCFIQSQLVAVESIVWLLVTCFVPLFFIFQSFSLFFSFMYAYIFILFNAVPWLWCCLLFNIARITSKRHFMKNLEKKNRKKQIWRLLFYCHWEIFYYQWKFTILCSIFPFFELFCSSLIIYILDRPESPQWKFLL